MTNSRLVLNAILSGITDFKEIRKASGLAYLEARNAIINLKSRQLIYAEKIGCRTTYTPRPRARRS